MAKEEFWPQDQVDAVLNTLKACRLTGEMPSFAALGSEIGISPRDVKDIIHDLAGAGVLKVEGQDRGRKTITFTDDGFELKTAKRDCVAFEMAPSAPRVPAADPWAGYRYEDDPEAAKPEPRFRPHVPIGTYGVHNYDGF